MCKRVIFLISFVLVLSIGSNALAEDLNEPDWACGDNTGMVFWEFLEDTNQPTREDGPAYYYPDGPADPVFDLREEYGDFVWLEDEGLYGDGAMYVDGEASVVQPLPDGTGENVTIYAQVTWKGIGGPGYLTLGLEFWEGVEFLNNIINEAVENLPPIYQADLGGGWTHSTYSWTWDPGTENPTYCHVLFFGASFTQLIIDEVVVDVVVHNGDIGTVPDGPGHPRYKMPTRPRPKDGAERVDPNGLVLSWVKDPCAVSSSEDVYFSHIFSDVNTRQGAASRSTNQDPNWWPITGEVNDYVDVNLGQTYYWAVDEGDGVESWLGPVWSFTVKTKKAGLPEPANDVNYVSPCPTLKWDPGYGAVKHYVYFDVNEVNVIGRVGPCTVLTEPVAESWSPGTLDWDTQYFWAVDENDVCDVLTLGEVWSFRVGPDPCDGPAWRNGQDTLYALWDFDSDWGGGRPVVDANWVTPTQLDWDPCCVDSPNGWHPSHTPPGGSSRDGIVDNDDSPVWTGYGDNSIRLKHNDYASLGQNMIVNVAMIWSGTGEISPEITVERLTNFGDGPTLGIGEDSLYLWWENFVDAGNSKDSNELEPLFTMELCDGWMFSFYEVEWKLIDEPADNIHVAIATSGEFYLDYVEVDAHWYTPPEAHAPKPADGAIGVSLDTCKLTWYPGAYVAQDPNGGHDVYFSTNEAAVADACASAFKGTQDDPCYPPGEEDCLELSPGVTYYWRVDEVNDTCDPCLWPGAVWEFTTVRYIIIDDFNDYDTTATIGQNPLRFDVGGSWKDYHNLPAYQGGTALLIGAPGGDTDPYHSAPKAMRLEYFTSFGIPVLERTFVGDPCNWTQSSLTTLVVYFWGDANSGGEDPCFATDLFVILGDDDDGDGDVDDSHTIYYVADSGGDAGDLIAEEWIEWNIALQDFNDGNNVNPDKIRSIGLGVKDGTTGNVYYDDIRLYVRRCVPMYAFDISSDPEGLFGGTPDCIVDEWDLAAMFDDWVIGDANVLSVDACDANLLVHYTFDACDLTDSAGPNYYHGIAIGDPCAHDGILTLVNVAETDDVNAVEIGGDFNDVNPFVGAIKGGGDFTIAMWFRTEEQSIFFSSCPYDPCATEEPNDTMPSNHSMVLFFILEPEEGDPEVRYDNWYAGGASAARTATGEVIDNKWHFLVVTHDADGGIVGEESMQGEEEGAVTGLTTVYLDGVPGTPGNFDPNLIDNEPNRHSIRIGTTHNQIMPYEEGEDIVDMTGDFDDVRIYDRVLPHGEIVNLMGVPPGEWFYIPVASDADLYEDELAATSLESTRFVNFKDYTYLMQYWLTYQPFPPEED